MARLEAVSQEYEDIILKIEEGCHREKIIKKIIIGG